MLSPHISSLTTPYCVCSWFNGIQRYLFPVGISKNLDYSTSPINIAPSLFLPHLTICFFSFSETPNPRKLFAPSIAASIFFLSFNSLHTQTQNFISKSFLTSISTTMVRDGRGGGRVQRSRQAQHGRNLRPFRMEGRFRSCPRDGDLSYRSARSEWQSLCGISGWSRSLGLAV